MRDSMQKSLPCWRQKVQAGLQRTDLPRCWLKHSRRCRQCKICLQGVQSQLQTYLQKMLGRQLQGCLPYQEVKETKGMQSLLEEELRRSPWGRRRWRICRVDIGCWLKRQTMYKCCLNLTFFCELRKSKNRYVFLIIP